MNDPTVRIKTFGCKVNQYDGQLLRESFHKAGWKMAVDGNGADVCVINACTVTAEADRRVRQALRRNRRKGAGLLVLTGCLPRGVEGLGADLVVANDDKGGLAATVSRRIGRTSASVGTGISRFHGRHRALLLVQTGCGHGCSYCIVPARRGAEKSRSSRQVVAEARRLAKNGHREIVLSGIRLGAYGRGLRTGRDLAGLVRQVLGSCTGTRLRLSSIEPGDVKQSLVRLVRAEGRVCPHLHLPVQSGSSRILKAMGRDYDRKGFLDLITRLRSARADLELSTDVMVGFPGEREEDFQATLSLVKISGFIKVHAFRFSARPGTAAASFAAQLPQVVKRERLRRLQEVCERVRRQRLRRMVGKRLEVLVEKELSAARVIGRAGNYAEVVICGSCAVGGVYDVRITGVEGDLLTAVR